MLVIPVLHFAASGACVYPLSRAGCGTARSRPSPDHDSAGFDLRTSGGRRVGEVFDGMWESNLSRSRLAIFTLMMELPASRVMTLTSSIVSGV